MFNFRHSSLFFALILSCITIFSQNPLLNEHSIKFENSSTASLVGENGLIMRTTNNGQSWTEQESNISNVLFGASFSGGISLAAGENGIILRSVDNGNTWDPILPGRTDNLNDINISGLNAVACGNNGTIYYSADGGQSWNLTASNTTRALLDIKFISQNTGFITGEFGTLLKTIDGGNSWTSLNLSFSNNTFNSVEAIDEDHLIVAGNEGSIFLSNDGGNSWFGPNGVMYETNFNEVVFFNSNEGILVGDNNLMLRTDDGGISWSQVQKNFSGDSYDFKSVSFFDANTGISVGDNGIEVYTTDGGISWSENSASLNPPVNTFGSRSKNIILNQNYPNPFNPSTNISYDLPFSANVSIKVYDIAGKEIASLFSGYQSQGSHMVHFDASSLSSGAYFYRLNVQDGINSFTKVNKMILTK